tara:strand:+ start:2225 stop:2479 length:255 start_codon:yes stop_codon:yes gene_type:complete
MNLIKKLLGRVINAVLTLVLALIGGLVAMIYSTIYSTIIAAKDGNIDIVEQKATEHKAFVLYWNLLRRIPFLKVDKQSPKTPWK